MSREITKNHHVLSYIEARNLCFFQKRCHFFEKITILHEIRDLQWMRATRISDYQKKGYALFDLPFIHCFWLAPSGSPCPAGVI